MKDGGGPSQNLVVHLDDSKQIGSGKENQAGDKFHHTGFLFCTANILHQNLKFILHIKSVGAVQCKLCSGKVSLHQTSRLCLPM